MNNNKLIIGLTGMPGSGKSIVVEAAKEIGYDVVTMGDVVREETAKQGLEPNPQNIGRVMIELRKTYGNDIIAERCISKIEQKQNSKIIVDGLRSNVEAKVFKNHLSNFILVNVQSSPHMRFKRLSTRERSDDPKTFEEFQVRDARELNVGIGDAIALSEYVIINDDTKDTLKARAKETLRRAEQERTK